MRKWLWLVVILCWRTPLAAQDIDANPMVQRRSVSTIADQISDTAERAAFLELFRQSPPADMLVRAEAFLSRFPQSAFLAQAYEVAARASFDLQKYDPGLDYARKSLALLPENPLLLVPVADVEARQRFNQAAIEDAEEAKVLGKATGALILDIIELFLVGDINKIWLEETLRELTATKSSTDSEGVE